MALTAKQKRFVAEYMLDLNANRPLFDRARPDGDYFPAIFARMQHNAFMVHSYYTTRRYDYAAKAGRAIRDQTT